MLKQITGHFNKLKLESWLLLSPWRRERESDKGSPGPGDPDTIQLSSGRFLSNLNEASETNTKLMIINSNHCLSFWLSSQ